MTQQIDTTSRTQDEIRRLAVGRGHSLNLDRVLVPLNGSLRSEQILPFASMLADWFAGEITLFHSLPPTHPARGARPGQVHYPDAPHDRGTALATAYLEEVVSRLSPHGVRSRWGIATGPPAKMISSRSATSSLGLVAIATAARSRPHRFFSHGLLDDLWRTTSVPLLIVNPHHATLNGKPPVAPKTIIVPRSKDSGESAIAIASALAGASRSKVKILVERSTTSDESEDELINLFTSEGIDMEIVQVDNDFTHQVIDIQNSDTGSWIVAGSRMRSGITRSLFGSVADGIARESTGPIVVVPDSNITRKRKRQARAATRDIAASL